MNKTTMYMKSINFCWSLYLFGFRSFSYWIRAAFLLSVLRGNKNGKDVIVDI